MNGRLQSQTRPRATRRAWSERWSERWPASPKGRIETEPRGLPQLRGVRGVARTAPTNYESPRSAMVWAFSFSFCLVLLVILVAGHLFPPSQDGPPGKKKAPCGIRLKSTRPSHGRVCWALHPPEARKFSTSWAFSFSDAHQGRATPPRRRASHATRPQPMRHVQNNQSCLCCCLRLAGRFLHFDCALCSLCIALWDVKNVPWRRASWHCTQIQMEHKTPAHAGSTKPHPSGSDKEEEQNVRFPYIYSSMR